MTETKKSGRIEMIWPQARMYRASGDEIRIGDSIGSDEHLSLRVEVVEGGTATARYTVLWET